MSASDDPERRDGFLARWSRRKREGTEEAQPATSEHPEPNDSGEEEEEVFDLSQLPDLDAITAETDLSLFFSKGVPEALKNAALRKMWTADVAIRDYIGPADFQWDFNVPDGVPGFGPLEADFDIETMLRQAIGGQSPPENATVETPPPEPHPVGLEALDDQSEAVLDDPSSDSRPVIEVAVEAAEEQISVSQISLSADANSGNLTESAEEWPVSSRRHGGALPV